MRNFHRQGREALIPFFTDAAGEFLEIKRKQYRKEQITAIDLAQAEILIEGFINFGVKQQAPNPHTPGVELGP